MVDSHQVALRVALVLRLVVVAVDLVESPLEVEFDALLAEGRADSGSQVVL